MKATVITHDDLIRRMDEAHREKPGLGPAVDSTAERMLRRLREVAEAANKLGRDGFEIKTVEYLETTNPSDPIWGVALEVRVIPKLKLREQKA